MKLTELLWGACVPGGIVELGDVENDVFNGGKDNFILIFSTQSGHTVESRENIILQKLFVLIIQWGLFGCCGIVKWVEILFVLGV